MESGKLNCRVTIQNYVSTLDSYGGQSETWTDYKTVWARIRTLSASEQFKSQEFFSEASVEISMRYPITISSKDRITFGSRYFLVLSHRNVDEGNKEVRVICKEVLT